MPKTKKMLKKLVLNIIIGFTLGLIISFTTTTSAPKHYNKDYLALKVKKIINTIYSTIAN